METKVYEFLKEDRVIQRLKLTQEQAESERMRISADLVESYDYMPAWDPHFFMCEIPSDK